MGVQIPVREITTPWRAILGWAHAALILFNPLDLQYVTFFIMFQSLLNLRKIAREHDLPLRSVYETVVGEAALSLKNED